MGSKAFTLSVTQEQALLKISKHPERSCYEHMILPTTVRVLQSKNMIIVRGSEWGYGKLLKPARFELTDEGSFIVKQLLRGKSFHGSNSATRKKVNIS